MSVADADFGRFAASIFLLLVCGRFAVGGDFQRFYQFESVSTSAVLFARVLFIRVQVGGFLLLDNVLRTCTPAR